MPTDVERAREAISNADCLLINAGAGMGVDSGLPDFRGNEGFWNAYPPYRKLGFNFMEMANPARFMDAPELGWGFYGHRLNLYRQTAPHEGFVRLLDYSKSLPEESFVFTSNVDAHFTRSGFENVVECHGCITELQCFHNCLGKIWPASESAIEIDEETMKAKGKLPLCPDCGSLARPNILMFGDFGWNHDRTREQEIRYQKWQSNVYQKRVVILEFGAGTAVPTVRYESEDIASRFRNSTLIRINPREPQIPPHLGENAISLSMGALEMVNLCLPPVT